ncbi:unnamed protein product, partial [Urochloa humidicola]
WPSHRSWPTLLVTRRRLPASLNTAVWLLRHASAGGVGQRGGIPIIIAMDSKTSAAQPSGRPAFVCREKGI